MTIMKALSHNLISIIVLTGHVNDVSCMLLWFYFAWPRSFLQATAVFVWVYNSNRLTFNSVTNKTTTYANPRHPTE